MLRMNKEQYNFSFQVYNDSNELNDADKALIEQARKVTEQAYAPYSHFNVGAVAKLVSGETVSGTNQENASFPAGICAERVMLASAATLFPGVAIDTLAISYHNLNGESDRPVSPCGICRQTLAEYEERVKKPIRLLLSGMNGKVMEIQKASDLLPFSFGSADLK
jgi:cytidine deaminase